ncbi:hypothetical protein QQP08_012040 [Theobroma cacao]|nr:hypothetical protein QQP08_012040 [Theobroma cacao]
MSSLAIFFLFCLSMRACNAHRLGFVAEEIGNKVHFLAKDVNQLKEVRPSVSMELQTQELGEVGVHGRRTRESWIGANAMKQTLFNCFLKAKEAIAKAISGHEMNSIMIISYRVEDLESKEKVQGFKRVTRSMLGNSAGETEKAVDSKEKDNVGDVDVMDYAQPHRKPPIHNEKP